MENKKQYYGCKKSKKAYDIILFFIALSFVSISLYLIHVNL